MTDSVQQKAEKKMAALEGWLAPLFEKAPHLPVSARQTLAKIAPWLALLFGVLGLLGLLGAGAVMYIITLQFLGDGLSEIVWAITVIAGILAAILELLAYKPLTNREKKGWNYLFYSSVLMTVAALFDLVFGYGSGAVSTIIFSLVGFWLLFEVRSLYH